MGDALLPNFVLAFNSSISAAVVIVAFSLLAYIVLQNWRNDIARAVEAAQAVAIPTQREIIHVIPRAYVIDGHEGIRDPIGMSGFRLEVETHIVTGEVMAIAQSRPVGGNKKKGQTFLNYVVPPEYGDSGGFQAGIADPRRAGTQVGQVVTAGGFSRAPVRARGVDGAELPVAEGERDPRLSAHDLLQRLLRQLGVQAHRSHRW